MTALADDQAQLLRALARHGVEFVVVGGVAAQIHGWRAATLDLDIAVSSEDSNVERLNAALASVGASAPEIGQFGSAFTTSHGRLEIVRRADGVGLYADWLRNAREHDVDEGLTLVVAAPEDILRSKDAAGRDKDLAALPQMRRDFNVAIVKRGFDALEAMDMDAFVAGWHPDVVWDVGGYRGWPGDRTVYRGTAEILAEYANFMSSVRSLGVEVHEITALDDSRVIALYTERRLERGNDAPVDLDVGIVYDLAGDRIVRIAVHTGHDEARRAAGA